MRLAYLDALLERRGPDSVIADIATHHGSDAAGPLRYVLLAHAYGTLDRPDSVTAVYARAVAEDASDAGLRFAYATALHASHREVDAQRELDSAAASGAMPPVVRYSLQARISLARGDSVAARDALARARAAAPADTSLATPRLHPRGTKPLRRCARSARRWGRARARGRACGRRRCHRRSRARRR